MVRFSKYVVIFILLSKVVALGYNQFSSWILSFVTKSSVASRGVEGIDTVITKGLFGLREEEVEVE